MKRSERRKMIGEFSRITAEMVQEGLSDLAKEYPEVAATVGANLHAHEAGLRVVVDMVPFHIDVQIVHKDNGEIATLFEVESMDNVHSMH